MRSHRALRAAAVAVALTAASPAVAAAATQDLRSPDTRDAAQSAASPAPSVDLRSPDTRDAAGGRGVAESPSVVVVPVPHEVAGADGMDWADAGIGAGGALVLVATGLAGAVAIGRRRHGVVLGRRVGSVG
jgi:hypothetical protein